MSKLSIALACFLLLHLHDAFGRIDEGNISTSQNWQFLTRFCFLGTADSGNGHVGRVSWIISYAKEYHKEGNKTITPHTLLLYPDDIWESVYPGEGMSCEDKKSFLDGTGNTRSVSPLDRFAGCSNSSEKYSCQAGTTFGTPREKWWYIVLANCDSTKGMQADYYMTMTNAQDGSIFFEHYSADEFFILQTDIGFLVGYFIMALLSMYVTYALKKLQLFHRTYKIYLSSLILELLSLIMQVGFWSNYGLSGIPKDFWKYLGRFLEFVSTIIFVVLLILMGKGYTITRGRIRKIGIIKIIALSTIYCLTTISMFIWEATSFDPGEVLYIYNSVPGYCLMGMRILAWIWFLYATIFTISKYSEKRLFYFPFVIIYTIWFWAGPIVAIAAINGMPKWQREKVVNGVNLLVVFLGHLIFLIMTWPSQANENFPYHVKTTQISAGNAGDPSRGEAYNSGQSNIDNSIFTTQTNGTTKAVDVDNFPHETGDYIQERSVAMQRLGS